MGSYVLKAASDATKQASARRKEDFGYRRYLIRTIANSTVELRGIKRLHVSYGPAMNAKIYDLYVLLG